MILFIQPKQKSKLFKMNDFNFPSISVNTDPINNAQIESQYGQLYSNDSKNSYEKDFNNFYFSPFVSLLIGIYEKAKENLHKNSQSTSKKVNFVVNIIGTKAKRGRQSIKKLKKIFMKVLNLII